ncbi:Probable RNA-directed DNA polymerase from transposon BS [Eumeta japonica]|uniref:Probable RNA-directed DNA polymerase from transposon BS n=1 Tax=Eumeta variegata TaxID=151549 RepID=A0A4C1TVI8_EUMVA|nr:Probable RNA-directed DNA polymerase from transposon BS [Eumeta japonica]
MNPLGSRKLLYDCPIAAQWNSQSVRRDKSDLIFLLQKYSPTVAAVFEIWSRPGSHLRVSGFACLRNDRSVGHSSVAVFIRNHTLFSPWVFRSQRGGTKNIQELLRREEEIKSYAVETYPKKTLSTFLKYVPKPGGFFARKKLEGWRSFSSGIDSIPYSFLISASEQVLSYYLDIVIWVTITGNVSITWKTQTIIPIFKNKGNPDYPAVYRPIALSSVLTKIVEHLVKNRLEWIADSRSLLANSQFGFRKGRNTIDSLSIFTSNIRVFFHQGKSVTVDFLDVSSAYNNAQLPILRNKFQKLKMPVRLSNFISNLLSERRILLRIGGEVKASRLEDPSADLHFRSIIENGWMGWHTIYTDASKLSEVECVGVGTFHSQYNIVQKIALAWVSGRSGIAGNEYVDLVAKNAISCEDKISYVNYSHDLAALSKKWLLLRGLITG